jgi:lipopolysaccharide transport system ATP-binding protein
MSTIIKAEGLSKKYIIGHQQERYLTLRDAMAQKAKDWGKRFLHPLQAASGLPLGNLSTSEEFWALKDISFEVQQGDRIGVIGRNGAGKSTLLKILSRITEPTSGRITINGRIASLLEVGTGFHPELTGRENIFLNGAILGMTRAEIKRKFDEIVDFAEVERFLDTPVKRYSSGMYVRLAFAVAAHLEPEILIIDEVLAVGDAQFQSKCLGKMEEVGEQGRTVLFVSHNMNAINRLCKSAILLSNGKIIHQAETSETVALYLRAAAEKACHEVKFPDNPEKEWQILSVSLKHPDNQPVKHALEINETFLVCIKYKIGRPLEGGYSTMLVNNNFGEVVLLSDNRDSEESISLEKPGIFEASIEIPLPLLTPGQYTITASIARTPTGSIDVAKESVDFEVHDNSGIRSDRAGHIFLPLVWASRNQNVTNTRNQ